MRLEEIKGNEVVRQALKSMVDTKRVPQAILFHEDEGAGGVSMAIAFLQYLISSPKVSKMIHPDIHFVFPVNLGMTAQSIVSFRELVLNKPYFRNSEYNDALGIENKSSVISVADANNILNKLSYNALEGGYKAVVMFLPEKLNINAANKLLKAIEEPPAQTLFLLITQNPEQVIPTIRSRCQLIRLEPLRDDYLGENDYIAEELELFHSLMSAILNRDLQETLNVGESLAAISSRDKARSFCAVASDRLRQIFYMQQGMEELVDKKTDMKFVNEIATKSKKTFPRMALAAFDRAQMLVGRNVNQKVLFCDLVNKLYIYF